MEITAALVKELRDETGAQMMLCKKALIEANGDIEAAKIVLRKMGIDNSARRSDREVSAGIIYSYIHDNRIGVMLELNCETDFVAKNEEFKALAKTIAMHIAWANPDYIDVTNIPPDRLKLESDIIKSQLKPEQEKFLNKILPGKMAKFYEKVCLTEQKELNVSEGKLTIREVMGAFSGKVGENVKLARFVRYEMGNKAE